MTKLSMLERCLFLFTLIFVLVTLSWFCYQNGERELYRITVDKTSQGLSSSQGVEENPSPGILEGERINLNTAPVEELVRLPGIGEARAESIVSYRKANGPFQRVEDLMEVSGIGEGIFERVFPYITVS